MNKKILLGVSMILSSATAFAQPNTVTITGNLSNNLTSNTSQFNYINVKISPRNASDSAYIKIGDGDYAPNQIFNLTPSAPMPYSIQWTGLTGPVYIWMYDSNTNSECDWYYNAPGSTYDINPHYQGSSSFCKMANLNDFLMSK